MSKTTVAIVLALAVVAVFGYRFLYNGAVTSSEENEEESSQTVGEGELRVENKTVNVKKGDNFSAVLRSNPSTGYQWEANFDPAYIKLVSSEYTPDSPQLIGSDGSEEFVFLVLKGGETEVKLSYLRPWEKNNLSAKEVVYKVVAGE